MRCAPTFVDRPAALDWSVTGVSQVSNDDAADPDATGSFDAVGYMRAGPGFLLVQAEGSTSENRGRVSGQFPPSNADAATAVDEDGDGRIQLSQVNYTQVNETFAFAAGLLDPSCYLDFSDIANDETWDFLAQPFTNNLAIAFPDYTLGGAVHLHTEQAVGLTLFLSSSNGLGDKDKASYSNLVDVTNPARGSSLQRSSQPMAPSTIDSVSGSTRGTSRISTIRTTRTTTTASTDPWKAMLGLYAGTSASGPPIPTFPRPPGSRLQR